MSNSRFVHVKVVAGAKKEKVVLLSDDRFIMHVREKAKDNRANARIFEILKSTLGMSKGVVRLRSGAQKPSKLFEIIEVDA